MHAGQNFFHCFEVHPRFGHVFCFAIFFEHLDESVCIALRALDPLHFIGVGCSEHLFDFTARFWDNIVAIGFGFIAEFFAVFSRVGDVLKCVIYFLGYRHGLQLGLIDAHADFVEIQDRLNLFQNLFLNFQLALCEGLINGALPNDLTQCGLGYVFDGFSLVVDLEQIVL